MWLKHPAGLRNHPCQGRSDAPEPELNARIPGSPAFVPVCPDPVETSMRNLILLGCLWLTAASPLLARPVQVSEAEFQTLTAGKPRIVEDFNRFQSGDLTSPVVLLNGQFSGLPSIGAPWCISSQCLNLNLATGVFSSLPARTEFWSTRLIPAGSNNNIYDFDVAGRGGTQRFTLSDIEFSPQGTFVGFHDPQGILQVTVSLRTGGLGINYSLDDVTAVVASAQQSVPAGGLGSYGLLAGILLMGSLWLLRRR